jgi:murein DD-endopeptidase MepM/ murein hydrolase activator NlpD
VTTGSFLIKIVPPRGYNVYRVHLSRRGLLACLASAVAVILVALGIHAWQLHQADLAVAQLQLEAASQNAQITAVDRQADELAAQLKTLQHENAEIRALIGFPTKAKPADRPTHGSLAPPAGGAPLAAVRARLERLAAASRAAGLEERRLSGLAGRVLELRRIASLARDRMIAALPSINPVDGQIVDGFGYRLRPWPEFHKGVDLAADYGAPVRAAAAGTVVSAGWDGGFGIKVDVDHGNGYHTWYAHLSRVGVAPGEHVVKGQTIASVGATGEATGPHLHYQVMRLGTAIDPVPYLNGIPNDALATLPKADGVQ